jgi:hypothetical protein
MAMISYALSLRDSDELREYIKSVKRSGAFDRYLAHLDVDSIDDTQLRDGIKILQGKLLDQRERYAIPPIEVQGITDALSVYCIQHTMVILHETWRFSVFEISGNSSTPIPKYTLDETTPFLRWSFEENR